MEITEEERLEMVRAYMAQPKNLYVAKHIEKAEYFRDEGNNSFKNNQFYEALVFYNASLCFSTPGSFQMATSYANRSAVYMECYLYKLCLENIELAIANNYPENKMTHLLNRKNRCEDIISEIVSDPNPYKSRYANEKELMDNNKLELSYESNPKIPFVIDALKLRKERSTTRQALVSNIDLKIGDVIAIENGFCKTRYMTNHEQSQYQHCSECLTENMLNLMPCDFCAMNMFCSDKCKDNPFHKHRCDIFTNMIDFASTQYRALKMFSYFLKFFGSIENLKQFAQKSNASRLTIFDFDFSDASKGIENYLKLINASLPTECENMKIDIEEMKLLKHHSEIFFTDPNLTPLWDNHHEFLNTFLSRMYKIMRTQTVIVGGFNYCEDENEGKMGDLLQVKHEKVGGSFCGIWHVMTHSCMSNTENVHVNGKTCVIVVRPISAGEKITTQKYFAFWESSKAERAEKVKLFRPFFKLPCECEACEQNYPVRHMLPVIDQAQLDEATLQFEEVLKCKQGYPHPMINNMKAIFKKYQSNFKAEDVPCQELVTHEGTIQHLFILICKVQAVWPLLRRHFYDKYDAFLPIVDGDIAFGKFTSVEMSRVPKKVPK